MAASRPIEDVLADPHTAAAIRQRLAQLPAIKDFARRELHLADSDSYRLYAQVGREALVWSVVAAPVDSLQPLEWCYPVIGCASYRGYFKRQAAQRYAAGLAEQGWDVAVEPVPAYSTLGWFSDPLPSTVIAWPLPDIVALVLHELAHETVYVPGDSAFNEAYATVVEQEGARRWLQSYGSAHQLVRHEDQQARRVDFLELLAETRGQLAVLYADNAGSDAMLAGKAAVIGRLRQGYAALKTRWGGYSGYDRWFDRPLNNAHFASIGTYYAWEPAFRRILRQQRGDMAAFHTACRAIADLPPEQRRATLNGLLDRSGA